MEKETCSLKSKSKILLNKRHVLKHAVKALWLVHSYKFKHKKNIKLITMVKQTSQIFNKKWHNYIETEQCRLIEIGFFVLFGFHFY